jgi:hypothetical protein
MRRLRLVVILATMAVGVVSVPAVTADTTWTRISETGLPNIVRVSLAHGPGGGSNVIAAWATVKTFESTNFSGFHSVAFSTSLGADASGLSGPFTTDSDWVGPGATQALVPSSAPGAVDLIQAGIHSTNKSDPLGGTTVQHRNADGSFSAPVVINASQYNSDPVGLYLADGTLLSLSDQSGGIRVMHGVPSGITADLQTGLGGCCGYSPRVEKDGAGNVWVAWASNATNNTGVYMEQLDPATGTPLGPAVKAPDSLATDNNNRQAWLACNPVAAGCRVVYETQNPSSPTLGSGTLVSWGPGETAPVKVAKATALGGRWAATYSPDGRLWVAWYDRGATGGTKAGIYYTLGDARGAGGTVLSAGQPAAQLKDGPYDIELLPVGGDLLIGTVADTGQGLAVWVNHVAPPQTAVIAPGPPDVTLQPAKHGKGFYIRVQYVVRLQCSNPCQARAEIRTRLGGRIYKRGDAKGLPGDGPVVLGSVRGLKLKVGPKVHFNIAVSRRALVRTPFHTHGGYRVGQTRLRVWLQTSHGEVLTVRDGRIRVSIARIKSGALPGLRGIL